MDSKVIKGLTSVLVIGWHPTPISAHMTMLCLANITKYTDVKDYELILIEDIPKHLVRDDYHVLKIDKHIILDKWTTYAEKINIASEEAQGEYLAIVQNDVFVWEGWLKNLRWYIENGHGDAVIPDQFPRSRQYILESYDMTMKEGLDMGSRDACLIYISTEAFKKTGGFNPELRIFQEADFYERMADNGINQVTTNKVQVSHMTLGSHYQDMDEFDKSLKHDSDIRNG